MMFMVTYTFVHENETVYEIPFGEGATVGDIADKADELERDLRKQTGAFTQLRSITVKGI